MKIEDRRKQEVELLGIYLTELNNLSPIKFTRKEMWEGYRRQSLYGLTITIVAAANVNQTDRGDDMFMTMLARHCQHALDMNVMHLYPGIDFKSYESAHR